MVLTGQSPGQSQLALQGRNQTVGEEHDSSFVALGLVDIEAALFEVDVLDPEVEGLTNSQPAAVEQVDNEPGGITINVGDVGQELEHLLRCGAMAQRGGSFGAQRINRSKLLFEDVAIKNSRALKAWF
jgi:hypothetical protein